MNDTVPESPNTASLDKVIEPDAHGQAALLLAEAILHALVETDALTLNAALSVIETTCEVKTEVAEQAGESDKRMKESLRLLRSISETFSAYPHQPE